MLMNKQSKNFLLGLAGLLVVSVLVMGAYFVFNRQKSNVEDIRPATHSGGDNADNLLTDESTNTGRQPKEQFRKDNTTVRILFGGDMMFDRHIRELADRNGGYDFLFENIDERLRSEDIVVANLEGPITSQPSKSVGSKMGEARNYSFTFDPSITGVLKKHNIQIVNIGNNHIMNFDKEGLAETRKYLQEAGVGYFGDPRDASHRWIVQEIKGLKVAFVNYNQFATGSQEFALEDISIARQQADVVVVYTHWGTEYVPANERQKQLAHAFIDAGADAVIGSHPHVVQEVEEYKEKRIYYSLGNFIFDQYFSAETRNGLLVEMTVDRGTKKLFFKDMPIILENDGQVSVRDERVR